jgi:RHS repeat-associated protein
VTLTFGRDDAGELTSLVGPWGTTAMAYNDRGLLSSVTDPAGGSFSLAYDPMGRLTGLTRPNGVADVLAYDPAGELLSRTSAKAGVTLDAVAYTYDTAGRRDSRTDAAGLHTYTYDAADRLTRAVHPTGFGIGTESFAYDPAGNRTSGGATYDPADRLLADATFTYTYDAEGNLAAKTVRATGATTHYAFDALHELRSVTAPDGSITTYRYDALGRRTEAHTATATTRDVYLGTSVIATYDGANTLLQSYVATLETVLAPLEMRSAAGTASYPLYDATGSLTALTDTTGAVASRFAYSAFGIPVGTPSDLAYAFATYGYDASTGLYYARARTYDSGTGRFLSEDPVAAINLYGYSRSNPVSLADPSGRLTVEYAWQIGKAAAQGAFLGGAAYFMTTFFTNGLLKGDWSLNGANLTDLMLSMMVGAVTGGFGAYSSILDDLGMVSISPGSPEAAKYALGALLGFESTVISMNAGCRSGPWEVLFGTVFGAIGSAINGVFRGFVGSVAMGTAQGGAAGPGSCGP